MLLTSVLVSLLAWLTRSTPICIAEEPSNIYMREQRPESERILSCERSLRLKWGCTKDLCCHLFVVVVDVVIEFAREGALSELLHAGDLVLISETIERLRNKFLKWKESFEIKGLKVNLRKTNVMVSGGITKDGMSKSKVDPCGVCSLRVKVNSVLCLQCGKWIHGRCARGKMATPKFSRNFTCRKCEENSEKCEGNTGEAVEQEEKSCDGSENRKGIHISW